MKWSGAPTIVLFCIVLISCVSPSRVFNAVQRDVYHGTCSWVIDRTIPEFTLPPVSSEVHVAWSLILSILFCKSLFVRFSFFCWSYFHLRLPFIHFLQIIKKNKKNRRDYIYHEDWIIRVYTCISLFLNIILLIKTLSPLFSP